MVTTGGTSATIGMDIAIGTVPRLPDVSVASADTLT